MSEVEVQAVIQVARLAVTACVWLALATFGAAIGLSVLAWWTAHKLRMRELCDPTSRTLRPGKAPRGVTD